MSHQTAQSVLATLLASMPNNPVVQSLRRRPPTKKHKVDSRPSNTFLSNHLAWREQILIGQHPSLYLIRRNARHMLESVDRGVPTAVPEIVDESENSVGEEGKRTNLKQYMHKQAQAFSPQCQIRSPRGSIFGSPGPAMRDVELYFLAERQG